MILSVCYRNYFSVVQFQNKAHIRNPHGPVEVFKAIWGAADAPNFYFNAAEGGEFRRPIQGTSGAPNMDAGGILISYSFIAVKGGA